jgi:S-adenosylmethionine hydrolase
MITPLTQPPLITLTTDFGTDSHYVAQMKGVILTRCRTACIVDLSHRITPQNVAEAGWLLQHTVGAFPEDTCHVVVVDPGVGTSRRLLLTRIAAQYFITPDNGLLWPLAQQHGVEWAYQLTRRQYWAERPSATFHGRDILASVAGHLTAGVAPQQFGPALDQLQPLAVATARTREGVAEGQIVYIDAFGNLITNIHRDHVQSLPGPVVVQLTQQQIACEGLSDTYAERETGAAIALIGSSDQLEIAVVNGNAHQVLRAGLADPVVVRGRATGQPA